MIRFSRIVPRDPYRAGKIYFRKGDGSLGKEEKGYLNRGRVFVDAVPDMEAFGEHLLKQEAGRAIFTYGLPRAPVPEDGLPVYAEKQLREGGITRSEKDFQWNVGPAVFAMDYDPDGPKPLRPDDLIDTMLTIAPGIVGYDLLWGCSSSSYIYNGEERLKGLGGQRLYFAAADGTDIPRAAAVMHCQAWLKGYGRIQVSGSGQQLQRSVTDPCMYQASRIDYAAGAHCRGDLEQRRPDPGLVEEGTRLVDTRQAFPALTAAETAEYARLVAAEKNRTSDEAKAQREVWGVERVDDMVASGVPRAAAEKHQHEVMRLAAADRPVLPMPFVVHTRKGPVTVLEILEDPLKFDGVRTADPLEPTYGGGRATGIMYPLNRRLVSQAHGIQRTYVLGDAEGYIELKSREALSFWSKK